MYSSMSEDSLIYLQINKISSVYSLTGMCSSCYTCWNRVGPFTIL